MSSNPQTPSKGRIVLFRHKGFWADEEMPAIVTRAHPNDVVDLQVFGVSGVGPEVAISYADEGREAHTRSWRWPPRV